MILTNNLTVIKPGGTKRRRYPGPKRGCLYITFRQYALYQGIITSAM